MLIGRFFSVIGSPGAAKGRSLYIDEAKRFLDEEIWSQIAKAKDKKLTCVLVDQAMDEPVAAKAKPLLASGQLLCHCAFEDTAKVVAETLGLGTAADILALPKYHFLARLTVGGEVQPVTKLKGVFPIAFPRYR